MAAPQRKTKGIVAKRRLHDPPIVAGMQVNSIPPIGYSTQQRILEAIPRSVEQSVTPLLLQAGQIPGKRAKSTILTSVLATELKENFVRGTEKFIDRLFPTNRAPFTIDSDGPIFKALANKGYWDSKEYLFKKMVFSESGMAEWLNNIGNTMKEVYGCSLKRLWWHGTCNLPPSGAPVVRKPDLVLLDHNFYEATVKATGKDPTGKDPQRINWCRIRSFAEVTSEKKMPSRMGPTINAKSYLSFILQFDRRFTTALSFCLSGEYSFTLTDRQGQIQYSASLGSAGLEHAQRFLIILAFLMFGNDSDIGLDPHFIHNDTDQLVAINIDNKRYELRDRIYTVESLLGRGTNVWIVTREDKRYILKDSWVLEDLVESEIDHLRAMLGHDEIESLVPTFVDGGDVKIDGITDSTAICRGQGLIGRPHNQRVHRRIVTGPVGTPLTTFRSKKEFVNALIGVVSAHKYLCKTLKILHCDISIGNVLLHRLDENKEAKGLLVDFDFAKTIEKDDDVLGGSSGDAGDASGSKAGNLKGLPVSSKSTGTKSARNDVWTGTPPFVAIEALLSYPKPFKQKPCHDLESILYVILYFCTYFKGPGMLRTPKDFPEVMSIPLERWFRQETITQIGRDKCGVLLTAEASLLAKFTPYWADFTPYIRQLISTCFPDSPAHSNSLTHDNVLKILQDAYNNIQEPPSSYQLEPRASSREVKRRKLTT